MWEQTEIMTRLAISYFNWIWSNIRWRNAAVQKARLTNQQWIWHIILASSQFFDSRSVDLYINIFRMQSNFFLHIHLHSLPIWFHRDA